MIKKLKNLFAGKSRKEILSDKDKATARGEPFIKVVNVNIDKNNPGDGYFELEWNKQFITQLREAGFTGADDEEVVDGWFTQLCRGITEQDEF